MADTKPAKRRLGDYEILRELGRGGMGLVYEARQLSLNRKVALKILAGSLGITPTAVMRFRREAEAAAKLHHTNIVPVYGIGEEDGTHFYAMELIEGPSLNHVIAHMRRTPSDDFPLPTGNGEGTSAVEIPEWVGETLTYNAAQPHAGARQMGAMAKRSAAMPKREKFDKADRTAADSTTGIKSGGNYFDTIARMIAEVADGLDYAHNHGVIHRDMKPSNLMLSPDGRVSINDFGLARMLEQPGMTLTGEFMGSPLYMSPEQIVAGRMPLDHRTDIYSLGATLYELLTLQPPFPGETRDRIIAQIMTKEPASLRKVNKRVPLDLETICLKALDKDPDRRYATAGAFADDLRRYVNRHAISARRTGLAGRTIKWARRHRATAAALAGVLVMSLIAAGTSYTAYRQRENARIKRGEDMLDQARADAMNGRYDEMEEHLGQAEVLDVDPGRLRLFRGRVAISRFNYEEALRHLRFAEAQLPDSLAAKALLCMAYRINGQIDKAVALTPTIVAMTPVEDEDYLFGAVVLQGLWPERAREWLETLAARKPSPDVHNHLGWVILNQVVDTYDPSDIEAALAHLGAATTQMPENDHSASGLFRARLLAADIHKVRGDDRESHRFFELARKGVRTWLDQFPDQFPEYAGAFNGTLALYEGRRAEAINYFRRPLAGNSNFPDLFRVLLAGLVYPEDRGQARAELDACTAEFQLTDGWVFARACVAAELEGVDAAAAFDHEWLAKPPPRPETGRTLAWRIFRFLGQPDEATQWARDYTDRAGPPIVPRPRVRVLDRYVRGEASGDILLAEATAAGSRGVWEHFLIGLERLSVGDRPGAIREFEKIEQAGNIIFAGDAVWGILFLERLREDPTWPPWIPVKPPAGE